MLGPGLGGAPVGGFARRLRNDFGASLTLSLSMPIFDFGVYRGRRQEAEALAVQADRRATAQARRARLELESAQARLGTLYREVDARRRSLPLARDAYLSAASLYAGGSGTALEVLDAYTGMMGAARAYAQAVFAYRVAEAKAIRWGTP
ncbi:MAG: hypothetical protein NVS2B9_10460 [Myxococcales bacterium]